jgi:hypothetical protein
VAERRRLQPKRLRRLAEIAEFDDLGEGVEIVDVAVGGHN